MITHPRARSGLCFLALWLAPGLAAAPAWQFDVVVDMTAAGRKVAHPSPEKPAYYYPVVAGYRQVGTTVAGEQPPALLDVVHQLARTLAAQGYLASHPVPADQAGSRRGRAEAIALAPPPSLILVFHWGCLNPVTVDAGTDISQPNTVTLNQNQMLAMVGGNTIDNLDLDFEQEAVLQGAERNLYFVTIAAYDFRSYYQEHRKVMLWTAKMSIPSDGVTLPQVVPSLIAAGGPFLGRETTRPKWVLMPSVPAGKVETGPPQVLQYMDATPAAGAAPAR